MQQKVVISGTKRSSKKPLRRVVEKDAQKESLIKELTIKLGTLGVKVRREKLKAGPGWRVVSGACRVLQDKLVFVDPRLTQEEQILLLRSYLGKFENLDENPSVAA